MATIIRRMTQVWPLESGQPWFKFLSDLGSVLASPSGFHGLQHGADEDSKSHQNTWKCSTLGPGTKTKGPSPFSQGAPKRYQLITDCPGLGHVRSTVAESEPPKKQSPPGATILMPINAVLTPEGIRSPGARPGPWMF